MGLSIRSTEERGINQIPGPYSIMAGGVEWNGKEILEGIGLATIYRTMAHPPIPYYRFWSPRRPGRITSMCGDSEAIDGNFNAQPPYGPPSSDRPVYQHI